MKNKIVLNLSNVNGKLRKWIAEQVKKNLAALGFNVGGQDHDHMGFSLGVNGETLVVSFDFNNENQATRHILDGTRVFNEHQLTEFYEAAKELAASAKPFEKPLEDRVVDATIQGVKIQMCYHGCGVVRTPENAVAFLRILLKGQSALDKFLDEALEVAKKEKLLPESAVHVGNGFVIH